MKRPKYSVTLDGHPDATAIKNAWNSATREARTLVAGVLNPGETAHPETIQSEMLDRWTTRRGVWTFRTPSRTITVRIELLNLEEITA